MTNTTAQTTAQTTLGDLISLFYREYLEIYGDEEIASLAAAASVNELLTDGLTGWGTQTEAEAA